MSISEIGKDLEREEQELLDGEAEGSDDLEEDDVDDEDDEDEDDDEPDLP